MTTTIVTLITVWSLFFIAWKNITKLEKKIDGLIENLTKFEKED